MLQARATASKQASTAEVCPISAMIVVGVCVRVRGVRACMKMIEWRNPESMVFQAATSSDERAAKPAAAHLRSTLPWKARRCLRGLAANTSPAKSVPYSLSDCSARSPAAAAVPGAWILVGQAMTHGAQRMPVGQSWWRSMCDTSVLCPRSQVRLRVPACFS